MRTKHSPAPWKFKRPHDPEEDHEYILDKNDNEIARIDFGTDGGKDAALMVAAPDLLKALTLLLKEHNCYRCDFCDYAKRLIRFVRRGEILKEKRLNA